MYINRFKETIIYEKMEHSNQFIDVLLAGITNPNIEYKINITKENHDWCVFEYVLSGKGHIEYDGQIYTVSAGDFYFYNSSAELSYYSDTDDPYKKIFINISGSIINNMADTYKLDELFIRHIDVSDIFKELHILIEKLDIEENPAILHATAKLMYDLIDTVADQELIFGSVRKISNAEKIHDYIDNHLTRHVTLSEIADKFFLSETHCIRIFRDKYGFTPMKYMLESRLKRSSEMVTSTDMPIQDIAAIFQFCDLQHYSKAFKRYFGISPAQFRESAKK